MVAWYFHEVSVQESAQEILVWPGIESNCAQTLVAEIQHGACKDSYVRAPAPVVAERLCIDTRKACTFKMRHPKQVHALCMRSWKRTGGTQASAHWISLNSYKQVETAKTNNAGPELVHGGALHILADSIKLLWHSNKWLSFQSPLTWRLAYAIVVLIFPYARFPPLQR